MNDLAYHIGQNEFYLSYLLALRLSQLSVSHLALPPQIGHFAFRLFENYWFFPSIRRCVDFDFSGLEVIFNLSTRCNYQLLK